MSNTQTATRARRSKKGADSTELTKWLASLDPKGRIKPSVHVNGHTFYNAVVVVDFGESLFPIDLDAEQSGELFSRIRAFTKEVVNREVNIVVHNDSYGVYWASVSAA